MYTTSELSINSKNVLVDSYTKDGITVNTFSPNINSYQRKKIDILIKERIKNIIREINQINTVEI